MFQYFIGNVYIFNAPPQEELPFVDFPFYSQGDDVPDSLLIQLDDVDLKDSSRERLNEYFSQNTLPIELIKMNSAVSPSSQIELANHISQLEQDDLQNLLWDGFPKYKQLDFCCGLIWNNFITQGKAGVFTYHQLTHKLFSLLKNQDIKSRIVDELTPGQFAAKNPDEAVERILDFDRNWAGFTFPRLLMVLNSIQTYILRPKLGQCGDYSFFAANVESLFRKPSLVALEEFGLPMQIGEKINAQIDLSENIDLAITQIRGYQISDDIYSYFESHIINDVKNHI